MVSPLILKWQSVLLVKHKEERDCTGECWKEAACWPCAKTSADLFVCWQQAAFDCMEIWSSCTTADDIPMSSTFFYPSYTTQDSICILNHLYWARTRRSSCKNPKPNLRLSTSGFILQPPHFHEWQLWFSRCSARNLGWSASGHNHRSHPKYTLSALPSGCTQKFRIQSLLITPPLPHCITASLGYNNTNPWLLSFQHWPMF